MRRRFTKSRPKNHKPPPLNCTALLRSGSIRCFDQNASAISGIRRPVRCETSGLSAPCGKPLPSSTPTLPSANRKSPAEKAGPLPNLKFSANSRSRPLVVVVLPGHVVLQHLVRHDFRLFIARALDAAYNSRLERLPLFQQLVRALRIHVLNARNPL